MNGNSGNSLTKSCPKCGTYGFRFLRMTDGGVINLKTPSNIVPHQPVHTFTQGLRMVCPNINCNHEYR